MLLIAIGVLVYSLFYFWVYGYSDFETMIRGNSLDKKKPQVPLLSTILVSGDSIARWEKLSKEESLHERVYAFMLIDSIQQQINTLNAGLSRVQDSVSREAALLDIIQLYHAAGMHFEKIRHIERRLSANPLSTERKQESPVSHTKSDTGNEAIVTPASSSMHVMNVRVFAYDEEDDQTNDADKAEYISGSLQLSGSGNDLPTGNIFVMVKNPDGDLMEDKEGDSGKFEINGKNTAYSFKIKNVTFGESGASLAFRFRPRDFEDGRYTVNIYGAGRLLGTYHFSLD